MNKQPGRQLTIYLDDETWKKLKDLPFGNSRSDKIRYCIRQMDPAMAVHHEALLLKTASMEAFLQDNPAIDELWWAFQFGGGKE
jgi:hypothetical protein